MSVCIYTYLYMHMRTGPRNHGLGPRDFRINNKKQEPKSINTDLSSSDRAICEPQIRQLTKFMQGFSAEAHVRNSFT